MCCARLLIPIFEGVFYPEDRTSEPGDDIKFRRGECTVSAGELLKHIPQHRTTYKGHHL